MARAVEGQMTSKELRVLVQLASQVPQRHVIVEVGSYRGRSTVALALGSQLGAGNRVFAIDPHLEFRGVRGGTFGPQDMAALYANLTQSGVGETVAVVCLPSVAAARAWSEQNVGLLWVDGDHTYEGVRADFEAWFPHMARDAALAFHDVDTPGVARLLSELADEPQLQRIDTVEKLSWLKKR